MTIVIIGVAIAGVVGAFSLITGRSADPLNQTRAEVLSCKQISPTFMRMQLIGDFSAYALPEAGLHFRFLLGPNGSNLPRWMKRA